jgi:hypothetical protein
MRPPSRKKARMTAAHSSRSSASSPTLKVIQVPRPITGSRSPLEGMGRVIGAACASAESGRSMQAAAPAAMTPISFRRLRPASGLTDFAQFTSKGSLNAGPTAGRSSDRARNR